MDSVPGRMEKMAADSNSLLRLYGLLAEFHVALPKEEFDLQWEILSGPKRVHDRAQFAQSLLRHERLRCVLLSVVVVVSMDMGIGGSSPPPPSRTLADWSLVEPPSP